MILIHPKNILARCCVAFFLGVACISPAGYAAYELGDLQKQITEHHDRHRQIFVALKDQIDSGDLTQIESRLSEIDGYPLQSYLEYLYLRKKIKGSVNPNSMLPRVNKFGLEQKDRRAHRRLLGELKNRVVSLERWADYLPIANSKNSPSHPCDDLLARVKNNQVKNFSAEAAELWARPARHTKSCDEAFPAIIKITGDIPTRALWRRTVTLLLSGKKEQVKELLRFYNKRDRKVVTQWFNQIDKPSALLQSPSLRGKTEHHRRLATVMLQRWGRKDLIAATNFWLQHGGSFGFSSEAISARINKNAVLAAKRGMPEAREMLLGASADDQAVRYWRVREALRSQDWRKVLVHLENLSVSEQQTPRWQYWRARSLGQLGYKGAAEKIFTRLAVKFDYHGFLAADQLATPYQIDVSHPRIDSMAIDQLLANSQISRAIEFYLVGIAWEGRGLWNRVLEDADDTQLIAAAHVALSVGWVDRAYAAIRKTSQKSALAFLFPTPYQELVSQTAAINSVSQELVYGVMRQESAFIPDVRSPAGAVGLMQLMPATARDMGKKIGVKAPAWKLVDSELNIRLGVKYLNYVLQRFDNNVVLAAAAYNAGPHRVARWVEGEALAADAWIETIPFDETRKYVKRVLFNTTVSDWRLQNGALTRLRIRMPDVLPLG